MIALYVPGRSPLHRLGAGWKLASLAALTLGVALAPRTPAFAVAGLAVALAGFCVARLRPRILLAQLWSLRWILLFMVVTQLLFLTPADALVNTLRVSAVLLLAGLLTLTTPATALLEALQRALAPLRRLGVDPLRVGIVLSLALTAIPVVERFAAEVRDAQRARGVRLGPRAIVPLLVMSLRHADEVGDALSARGLD